MNYTIKLLSQENLSWTQPQINIIWVRSHKIDKIK